MEGGEVHPAFSISSLGFGFSGGSSPSLPPPPPCVEVLTSETPESPCSRMESVSINAELSLLKGRVNTGDIFSVPNSDLEPGKYEGGLKLWEGSVDLVKFICSEIEQGRMSLLSKRVLELGCGHGLPGIYACIKGAASVDFQDFNAEVLRCLTIPNVEHNLTAAEIPRPPIRFIAGDWTQVPSLLLPPPDKDNPAHLSSCGEYDVILTAETVYSLSSLESLYQVMKKCLRKTGVAYVAGKKHYFGVGGGTRQFARLVNDDGTMVGSLVAEMADGSSNVRELWKFSFPSHS